MKDLMKRQRKLLRPGGTLERRGKGIKVLNRRICRRRLKEIMRRHGE